MFPSVKLYHFFANSLYISFAVELSDVIITLDLIINAIYSTILIYFILINNINKVSQLISGLISILSAFEILHKYCCLLNRS